MKILFVCRANVGRSQIAESLFKKYSSHKAISAGTIVENEGQMIKDLPGAKNVIEVMKREGLDISRNKRNQVTPEMVDWADKIIVMAEKETIPDFLKNSQKTIMWEIEDLKDKSLEENLKRIPKFKRMIQEFIREYDL
jgi:protein-tyrosine-phosphatase